jgi:hypothetical protein
MKISRFNVLLSLCALLFGSTVYAGSLSRAIVKVAPAMIVDAEEPAEITVAATVPTTSSSVRADRIVSSTASPAVSTGASSRRQSSTQQTSADQAAAPSSATTAASVMKSIKPAAPEGLAHKPAVAAAGASKAAEVSGRIIHPTYPPKTSTEATALSAEAKPNVDSTPTSEPTLAAEPKSEFTVVVPKTSTPAAASSTTQNSSTEKTPLNAGLHNALRDAAAPQEHSLRGPNAVSSAPPALLAPSATPLRSGTEPKIVRPIELGTTPALTATKKVETEATTPSAPKSLSSGIGSSATGSASVTAPKTTASPVTSSPSSAVSPRTSVSSIAPSTTKPAASKEFDPRGSRPQAVASDLGKPRSAPVLSTDPSQPSRLPLLRNSDDEAGEKSVIGKAPVEAQSRQLFESQEEVPLTPEMVQLKKRTQAALAHYYQNWTLNTRDHSPWEVMHAIVAYGVDTRLRKGGPGGEPMTAIGHLCFSGVSKNMPILTMRKGELYALRGPGVQGHSGQFLAILAQSYLQRDYPLYVGGQQFTLEDLIEAEKKDCEAGTELTFKLISLMHYLPSDAKWTNFQGQDWSLDRLVREEIVQPIRGAACGGTHRLMGLSYAVRKREQRGEPITGIYLEAQKYIDEYHKYTWSLQNPDGSFSTGWFVKKEARPDIDRRMQTTGHTLEWLAFSLSDEELRDPKMVKAVKYVTDLLLHESVSEWEIGHLGHALHALQIYNERVFGGPVRSFEGLVSRRPLKTAQRPTPGR